MKVAALNRADSQDSSCSHPIFRIFVTPTQVSTFLLTFLVLAAGFLREACGIFLEVSLSSSIVTIYTQARRDITSAKLTVCVSRWRTFFEPQSRTFPCFVCDRWFTDQANAQGSSNIRRTMLVIARKCLFPPPPPAVLETLQAGHCGALRSVNITIEGRHGLHRLSVTMYQDFLTNTPKNQYFPQIPAWPIAWFFRKKAMIASLLLCQLTPQPTSEQWILSIFVIGPSGLSSKSFGNGSWP